MICFWGFGCGRKATNWGAGIPYWARQHAVVLRCYMDVDFSFFLFLLCFFWSFFLPSPYSALGFVF